MLGFEPIESLEHENKVLSFAYTVDRLTNNSIEAASLFETHSSLEYNGRWEPQDLQMDDERVEQQFGELVNAMEDGATAYRFLRQDLEGEDLPDQHEDLYEGLKERGDDIMVKKTATTSSSESNPHQATATKNFYRPQLKNSKKNWMNLKNSFNH